jgi:hypothetical protein
MGVDRERLCGVEDWGDMMVGTGTRIGRAGVRRGEEGFFCAECAKDCAVAEIAKRDKQLRRIPSFLEVQAYPDR